MTATAAADDSPGLDHLLVLDLSRTDAGAIAASTLAWLGATVVRIEAPDVAASPDRSGARYAVFNASKRSVTIDLADRAGVSKVLDLAERADVVVEDWGHGVADQAGLGHAAFEERNPGIVYGQVTTFSAQSRFAAMPINEGVAEAVGGLVSITGSPDGPPLLAGFELAATASGLFTALGVLATLYERDRTSVGRHVMVSMQEAVTSLMRGPWGRGMRDGGRVVRSGNGFADVAPMDVYSCAPGGPDDYVYLFVGERDGAAGWHAMLGLLDRGDLAGDPRFETASSRAAHRADVDEMIRHWTSQKSKAEVMDLAVQAGVICGAVLTTADLAADNELWERGSMLDAVLPDGRRVAMPGGAITLSSAQPRSGLVAAPGEHNDDLDQLVAGRTPARSPATSASDEPPGRPLSGLRIVDLTHAESGPFATEMLAMLGAEVVKVERPPDGEYMRRSSAFTVGQTDGTAPAFGLLNANKKSVVIDLKNPNNLESLRALIRGADVFVENFFPGAIDRMGLGYEELRELNPRLVYAQLSGYPHGTAKERYPSFDMVGQASSGLMAVTGYEDGPPHRVGAHVSDSGAGLHLAVGILAALNQRAITNRGQRVRVSMQESGMNFSRSAFAHLAETGRAPARRGNHLQRGCEAAIGIYKCAGQGDDDYCFIDGGSSPAAWEGLVRAIGLPGLHEDERFHDAHGRRSHRAELDRIIEGWTQRMPKDVVMEMLHSAGVPAGAVLSVSDLITRPDYWEQGTLDDFVISPGVNLPMINLPVRLSGYTRDPYWLAEAGMHNSWFEGVVGRPIQTDGLVDSGARPSLGPIKAHEAPEPQMWNVIESDTR